MFRKIMDGYWSKKFFVMMWKLDWIGLILILYDLLWFKNRCLVNVFKYVILMIYRFIGFIY